MWRCIDRLWMNTIEQLLEAPDANSRVGKTKELIGFSTQLYSPANNFLLNRRRKLSPIYGCAEFLWYMKHTKKIEMIKAYAPQYEKFAEDGEAHGAYGWRLYENLSIVKNTSQLVLLINHLRHTPDSRQAILTLWNADDLHYAVMKNHKDLPCTLSLQFFIRNGYLHLITTMRSNDAWLGLPYDIFTFTCIQKLVSRALGLPCGVYTHQVGSMHLYEKNWVAAEEALHSEHYETDWWRLEHEWSNDLTMDWHEQIQQALCAEGRYRKGLTGIEECIRLSDFLYDIVVCCSHQFGKPVHKPRSPILLEALNNANH